MVKWDEVKIEITKIWGNFKEQLTGYEAARQERLSRPSVKIGKWIIFPVIFVLCGTKDSYWILYEYVADCWEAGRDEYEKLLELTGGANNE